MKTLITAAAMALMTAMPAQAETNPALTFDPRIAYIRAIDTPFGVEVQFFAPRNGRITCMVYDADLKPLATAWTFAEIGAVDVTHIKASDVEGMICRYADLI